MQADDLQTRLLGMATILGALFAGELADAWGERERGDFQAAVAEARHGVANTGMVPIAERFVADGEFHGRILSRWLRQFDGACLVGRKRDELQGHGRLLHRLGDKFGRSIDRRAVHMRDDPIFGVGQ